MKGNLLFAGKSSVASAVCNSGDTVLRPCERLLTVLKNIGARPGFRSELEILLTLCPNESATRIGPMTEVMPRRVSSVSKSPPARSNADRVIAGRMLELMRQGADCREKKVRSVRRSVRARQYENDLKLSIAVERLVRDQVI